MMVNGSSSNLEDIQQVVDFVVDVVNPLRVVLFGSAARGELRHGSDIDLLVIVDKETDPLRAAQNLYLEKSRGELRGRLIDFVVTTPERYEAGKESFGSVFREIEIYGRELYAAAA